MLTSGAACPAWILSHRCEESSVWMIGWTRVSGRATPRITTDAEIRFWAIFHAANKQWCCPRPSHRTTLTHCNVGVGCGEVELRRRHCAGCTSYLLQQHASVQRNMSSILGQNPGCCTGNSCMRWASIVRRSGTGGGLDRLPKNINTSSPAGLRVSPAAH